MWYGSGLITQLIYSTFAIGSGTADQKAILTENSIEILTESNNVLETET